MKMNDSFKVIQSLQKMDNFIRKQESIMRSVVSPEAFSSNLDNYFKFGSMIQPVPTSAEIAAANFAASSALLTENLAVKSLGLEMSQSLASSVAARSTLISFPESLVTFSENITKAITLAENMSFAYQVASDTMRMFDSNLISLSNAVFDLYSEIDLVFPDLISNDPIVETECDYEETAETLNLSEFLSALPETPLGKKISFYISLLSFLLAIQAFFSSKQDSIVLNQTLERATRQVELQEMILEEESSQTEIQEQILESELREEEYIKETLRLLEEYIPAFNEFMEQNTCNCNLEESTQGTLNDSQEGQYGPQ